MKIKAIIDDFDGDQTICLLDNGKVIINKQQNDALLVDGELSRALSLEEFNCYHDEFEKVKGTVPRLIFDDGNSWEFKSGTQQGEKKEES